MKVARQFIAWYPCENGNRPVGHGMIGSDRRATTRTTNHSGVRIRPCPTGRILDWTRSSPESFRGWLRSLVPSGQQIGRPVHIFDSRPHIEDEDDDEDEDEDEKGRARSNPLLAPFPGPCSP
jgi:hypothetical protein